MLEDEVKLVVFGSAAGEFSASEFEQLKREV